jgi:predicted esterase
MVALTPTMIAHGTGGERHQLTPPPEHILPAAALEAAKVGRVALHLHGRVMCQQIPCRGHSTSVCCMGY